MLSGLAFAVGALALRSAGVLDIDLVRRMLSSIDFGDLVLHGLLAFLLFAGALHVDLNGLRSQGWAVALLATLGVAISTASMGVLFWLAVTAIGSGLAPMHALLFGALIAPTDPIAVLGVLRKAGVPRAIEIQITGESLFNDGVAVVIFLTLLNFTFGSSEPSAADVALFLAREGFGALLVGATAGYLAYRLLAGVDEYPVEVLITLGTAMGTYSVAEMASVSAPISVVVAGLVIGNPGRARAMSDTTRGHVDSFWELLDYVINALLFVLLGLEVLLLESDFAPGGAGWMIAAAVPLALIARFVGVWVPIKLLLPKHSFGPGTLTILTWGGLKGGISLALALSLPDFAGRDLILNATYSVVVFSMAVQGLTLHRVATQLVRRLPGS